MKEVAVLVSPFGVQNTITFRKCIYLAFGRSYKIVLIGPLSWFYMLTHLHPLSCDCKTHLQNKF